MEENREIAYYLNRYGLSGELSDEVKSALKIYRFRQGEHIIRSGGKLEYFYFFVEGKAKVYTLQENGRSLLVRFYLPLEIIGEVEMFTGRNSICHLQALTESVCLGIKSSKMLEACRTDCLLMEFFCRTLSRKLLDFNQASSINQSYPLENRLASYLLSIPDDGGRLKTDSMSELADLLGTSYRHLSRTVKDFTEQGILEKKGKVMAILDQEKLKELGREIYT